MTLTPRGKGAMKAFLNILRNLGPHLKKALPKALPFLGAGLTGVLGFFLGAKWKYKQYEKKYAAVCEALLVLQEKIKRLEAERAPKRELRKARKELEEKAQEKLEIEEKLEELKRDAR